MVGGSCSQGQEQGRVGSRMILEGEENRGILYQSREDWTVVLFGTLAGEFITAENHNRMAVVRVVFELIMEHISISLYS